MLEVITGSLKTKPDEGAKPASLAPCRALQAVLRKDVHTVLRGLINIETQGGKYDDTCNDRGRIGDAGQWP
jgi:hypothetical protein